MVSRRRRAHQSRFGQRSTARFYGREVHKLFEIVVVVALMGALFAILLVIVTTPRRLHHRRTRKRGGTPAKFSVDQLARLDRNGRRREIVAASRFAERTRTPEAYYALALLWEKVIEEQPRVAEQAQLRHDWAIEQAERAKVARGMASE